MDDLAILRKLLFIIMIIEILYHDKQFLCR